MLEIMEEIMTYVEEILLSSVNHSITEKGVKETLNNLKDIFEECRPQMQVIMEAQEKDVFQALKRNVGFLFPKMVSYCLEIEFPGIEIQKGNSNYGFGVDLIISKSNQKEKIFLFMKTSLKERVKMDQYSAQQIKEKDSHAAVLLVTLDFYDEASDNLGFDYIFSAGSHRLTDKVKPLGDLLDFVKDKFQIDS